MGCVIDKLSRTTCLCSADTDSAIVVKVFHIWFDTFDWLVILFLQIIRLDSHLLHTLQPRWHRLILFNQVLSKGTKIIHFSFYSSYSTFFYWQILDGIQVSIRDVHFVYTDQQIESVIWLPRCYTTGIYFFSVLQHHNCMGMFLFYRSQFTQQLV